MPAPLCALKTASDKRALVDLVIAHLAAELQRSAQAARAAQAEATDEQSRAENKYDTRGLEASYLSHGQSRQALETGRALQQFAVLHLRAFGPLDPIDLGAVVELEHAAGERAFYFLGPSAGGVEVARDGIEVSVITPLSPLGRQLMGQLPRAQLAGGPTIIDVR